jgi:hypothetical protein
MAPSRSPTLFISRLSGIGIGIERKKHLSLFRLFRSASHSKSMEIIDTQETTSSLPPPIDHPVEGITKSEEPYPSVVVSRREITSPELDTHLFEQLVNTFGEMLSGNILISGKPSAERQSSSSSITTNEKSTVMNPKSDDTSLSSLCSEKPVCEPEIYDPPIPIISSPSIEINSTTKKTPKSATPSPVHILRNRVINKPKNH